jgi:hypothetical protein
MSDDSETIALRVTVIAGDRVADDYQVIWRNVAEHDGPTMLARIGVMRALNRHVERVFDPSRKDKHWGRRKLARDR